MTRYPKKMGDISVRLSFCTSIGSIL